jgi:hypothetical protein
MLMANMLNGTLRHGAIQAVANICKMPTSVVGRTWATGLRAHGSPERIFQDRRASNHRPLKYNKDELQARLREGAIEKRSTIRDSILSRTNSQVYFMGLYKRRQNFPSV